MLSHAQLRFPSRHHLAGPLPVAVSSQYAQHHCRNKRVCRWAPDRQEDPQDDAPHTNTSSSTANADPMQSRRLINQLLQIQSLQSVDLSGSADEGQQDSLSSGVSGHQQPQQNAAGSTLFDDPAAEDYDPLLLDMLGFTSVSQYLDSKLSAAAGEAKVSLIGLTTWALMGAAVTVPLGGSEAYTDSLAILTDGGLDMRNLAFLWVGILSYFSIKGAVMSLVTGVRSWRLHEQQGDRLEELAGTVQAQDQCRAFWQLQERLQRAYERANRTYAEFALSSLLLGVLLLMNGGTDHLELQLETLDQEAFLTMLVIVWWFWEAYFAAVGSVLKVSELVSAAINKWTYNRKWGRAAPRDKQQ